MTPPGAAREMRFAPTSSATVWLPSITRAMRIQVVNGNARSAAAAHIREIERDQAEAAGLEDEVHRLERCQAAGRVAASPVPRTHSSRREIEAERRG